MLERQFKKVKSFPVEVKIKRWKGAHQGGRVRKPGDEGNHHLKNLKDAYSLKGISKRIK